jgi:starch-binding outer membrane protein, SusD/RagB family
MKEKIRFVLQKIALFNSRTNHLTTKMWWIVVLPALYFGGGCKKFITVDAPGTSLTSDNVYKDDATAAAVLTDIYATLSGRNPINGQSINSISLITSLSSDEATLHGGSANANVTLSQHYLYTLNSGSQGTTFPTQWSNLYAQIYVVNLAIERLEASSALTPSVKAQLQGEARFLRALFYFYLTNLYGDAPLITTTDYRTSTKLSRNAQKDIYLQIISDLTQAQGLLSDDYRAADAKNKTQERVRPNKVAATALLARAYLYTDQWVEAELQATSVINNMALYDTVSLQNVFLKNSKEAIWQLQPVNTGWNTEDARIFIIPSTGPTSNSSVDGYPVYLSSWLLNAFEAADKRKEQWIGTVTVGSGAGSATYYFPYKYKSAMLNAPVTEYTTVFRLGEQYLIRAEARAQLEKISEGLSDLNVIRKRAGLSGIAIGDKPALLKAIYKERQVELFTEWGHRWLDLKRTNQVDAVIGPVALAKGISWNANWALYPIPLYDITQNPSIKQNLGY